MQGVGGRDDATEFQLDGLNANAGMDERGMAIPNVDTIAEFSVETNSFSAEQGRNPLQVLMLTKSGTNEFHGTAWEFLRNEKLDAFNTFAKAAGRPKAEAFQEPIRGNDRWSDLSKQDVLLRELRRHHNPAGAHLQLEHRLAGNAEWRFLRCSHADSGSADRPAVSR